MRKGTLLIVDDEPDILDICSRSLAGYGFDVTTASSGEEALDILKEGPVDILVTDINMSGIGGVELIEIGKKLYPEMSPAVITGHGDLDLAVETMNMGAEAFIVKPFTPSELRTTIDRLFQRNTLMRENLKLKALMPLLETSRKLIEKIDTDGVCKFVAAEAMKGVKGEGAAIFLKENDEFRLEAKRGSLKLPDKGFFAEIVREKRHATVSNDQLPDSDIDCPDTKRSIVVPVLFNGKDVGALIVGKAEGSGEFTEGDIEYLGILANHLSSTLECSKLYRELKLALDEAEGANRVKDAFLRNMSHEFRTPLNIIVGFAEVLIEHGTKGAISSYQEEELQIIKAKGYELLKLFENMLDATLLDAGKIEVQNEQIDVSTLMQEASMMFEEKGREKGLHMKVALPEADLKIIADRELLRKILDNILDNAVKFTEKGEIDVSAAREGEEVLLNIRDTGVGVDPAAKENIFEKFTQADDSLTREFGGIGIGLYLAGKMAELMGGRIDIKSPNDQSRSDTESTGTDFIVRLPVCH